MAQNNTCSLYPEIKCDPEDVNKQIDIIEKNIQKFEEARKKIKQIVSDANEEYAGNSIVQIFRAFEEFDKEYDDMGSVIKSYVSELKTFSKSIEDVDIKYKKKINSID